MNLNTNWKSLILLAALGLLGPARLLAQEDADANIALDCKATMSSIWESKYPASKGVNGKTDRGNFFHTKLERNPWWQVDLGAVKELQTIELFNRLDFAERAKNIVVLVSADDPQFKAQPIKYTKVYDSKNEVIKEDTTIPVPPGTKARYIRVKSDYEGEIFLHLTQVKVFEKLANPTNGTKGITDLVPGTGSTGQPETPGFPGGWPK